MRNIIKVLTFFGSSGLKGEDEKAPEKLRFHKLEDIVCLKDRLLTHCLVPRRLSKRYKGDDAIVLYEHHLLIEAVRHSYGPMQPSSKNEFHQTEVFDATFYEFSTKFGLFSKRDADTWTYTATFTRINIFSVDSNNNKSCKLGKWKITSKEKSSIQDYLSQGIYVVEDRSDYLPPQQALERAKKFTSKTYKRTYRMQRNNCEHFATACFGMVNGRGWSFQTQKAATPGVYTKINIAPSTSTKSISTANYVDITEVICS